MNKTLVKEWKGTQVQKTAKKHGTCFRNLEHRLIFEGYQQENISNKVQSTWKEATQRFSAKQWEIRLLLVMNKKPTIWISGRWIGIFLLFAQDKDSQQYTGNLQWGQLRTEHARGRTSKTWRAHSSSGYNRHLTKRRLWYTGSGNWVRTCVQGASYGFRRWEEMEDLWSYWVHVGF